MRRLPDPVEEYVGRPLTPPAEAVKKALLVLTEPIAYAAVLVGAGVFGLAAFGFWQLTT